MRAVQRKLFGCSLLLIVGAWSGCGSPSAAAPIRLDGAADGPDAAGAGDASVDGAVPCVEPPPTFAEVQKLFDTNCVTCHVGGVDLDLQAGRSYANLVGQAAPPAEGCGGQLVVPGSPDTSYLYLKLTTAKPCAGAQMPLGEFFSTPLPRCQQQLVRDWIAAGALPADAAPQDAGASTD